MTNNKHTEMEDEELKIWAIINKIQSYDAEAISLLLDDKELKQHLLGLSDKNQFM